MILPRTSTGSVRVVCVVHGCARATSGTNAQLTMQQPTQIPARAAWRWITCSPRAQRGYGSLAHDAGSSGCAIQHIIVRVSFSKAFDRSMHHTEAAAAAA